MTLGERLQQLRKEKQMSQEDLGNLLLVSRQTVSLWENNQTVPTVDNLIRLKEIFGVSIDSILTGEAPPVPEEQTPSQQEAPPTEFIERPIESYSYSLEKKDLSFMSRFFCNKRFGAVLTSIGLFLFISIPPDSETNFGAFISIAFTCLAISLIIYIRSLLQLQKAKKELCNTDYICELFRDYFFIIKYKNNEVNSTIKIYHTEIKECWDMPHCCFFITKERTFFPVKKDVFTENSGMAYWRNCFRNAKTDFHSKKIVILKTAATVLFVASFISIFAALLCSAYSMEQNKGSTLEENFNTLQENMGALRAFHWFLPIPILSVVTGILLNKNKIRNKKNIIAGVVIGLLMLIYGFFPTIFANIDNNLESLEAKLGFELPEHISYSSTTTTGITGEKQRVINLSFTESASNEFEAFILEDERWSDKGKEGFSSVYPPSKINVPYDLFLIYNVTTDEFGKLPDSDGKYEFIYIAYDTERNSAYIFEYTLDYQSQH